MYSNFMFYFFYVKFLFFIVSSVSCNDCTQILTKYSAFETLIFTVVNASQLSAWPRCRHTRCEATVTVSRRSDRPHNGKALILTTASTGEVWRRLASQLLLLC